MSVVFNVLKNDYSLIATDTRIMLVDTSVSQYSDEYSKLYISKHGWVSGTGVGELIRNMIDKLDEEVENNLHEEILKLSSKYNLEDLQRTLISFSTLDDEKHLKLFFLGSVYRLIDVKANILIAMQPSDIDEVKWNKIYETYSEKITVGRSDLDSDIKTIAEAINEVSKNCLSVSDICDIGILTRDGYMYHVRKKCKDIIKSHVSYL